ncbi:MAG: hypothetical protein RL536_452, partial [Candidatus Parcubacteria bacterium]
LNVDLLVTKVQDLANLVGTLVAQNGVLKDKNEELASELLEQKLQMQTIHRALDNQDRSRTTKSIDKVEFNLLPDLNLPTALKDQPVAFILFIHDFKEMIASTNADLSDKSKKNQLLVKIQKYPRIKIHHESLKDLTFDDYCSQLVEKFVKRPQAGLARLRAMMAKPIWSNSANHDWQDALDQVVRTVRSYMLLYEIIVRKTDIYSDEERALLIKDRWWECQKLLHLKMPREVKNSNQPNLTAPAFNSTQFTGYIDLVRDVDVPPPTLKKPSAPDSGQESSSTKNKAKRGRSEDNFTSNRANKKAKYDLRRQLTKYNALTRGEASQAQLAQYWKKGVVCKHDLCELEHDYQVCRFNPDCIRSQYSLDQIQSQERQRKRSSNFSNNNKNGSNYFRASYNSSVISIPIIGSVVTSTAENTLISSKDESKASVSQALSESVSNEQSMDGNKIASKHSENDTKSDSVPCSVNHKNCRVSHRAMIDNVNALTPNQSATAREKCHISGRRDAMSMSGKDTATLNVVENSVQSDIHQVEPKASLNTSVTHQGCNCRGCYATTKTINSGFVNGKIPVKVHIDPGAEVSSISFEFLKRHPILKRRIHHRAKYYADVTGAPSIPSLGTIKISLFLGGITFQGRFEVMTMPFWDINLGTDKYDFELKLFEKHETDQSEFNVEYIACIRDSRQQQDQNNQMHLQNHKETDIRRSNHSPNLPNDSPKFILPEAEQLPKCLDVDAFQRLADANILAPLPKDAHKMPLIICTVHHPLPQNPYNKDDERSHLPIQEGQPEREMSEEQRDIILEKFLEKELQDTKFLDKPYTEEQKEALTKLMHKLKNSFSIHKTDKPGRYTGPAVDYQPQRALPAINNYSRMSPGMRKMTIECLKQLTTLGHIKPYKEGKHFHRFMVKPKPNKNPPEGRPLNDLALKNKSWDPYNYPLPRIKEELHKLHGSRWFTKLDMTHGYAQIPLAESMHPYFTFSINGVGVYTYTVIPQGWAPAGAIFEEIVEFTLGETRYRCCIVYLDDNIIHSPNFNQHLIDVEEVVTKYSNNGFRFSLAKTMLAKNGCECLGHYTDGKISKPLIERTKAVTSRPPPESREELRSWIQFLNYYREYINQFAVVAHPLYQLLRKDSKFDFKKDWTPDSKELQSLNKLKAIMTTEPIMLHHPDPDKEYIL